MINDFREFLHGTGGQYRRDLIHAMLVDDPMNADPANGKTPYLRSKKKRQELILQAIEEAEGCVEEWLEEVYERDFDRPYIPEYADEEDEEEYE